MARVFRSGLIAALFTAVVAIAAGMSGEARAAACPANMTGYNGAGDGDALSCACPAGTPGGSVWGSGTYTTDSNVCRAAVHAGVVNPSSGGNVTVYMAPGCGSYVGTSSNGVSTGKWGPFKRSFVFSSPGPECQTAVAISACPRNLKALQGQMGKSLTCSCKPQQFGGSIWGSHPYTTDSSVCGAALHAGVIAATGGTVTAKTMPGCPSYSGSESNGIKTSGWGSYNTSFYFTAEAPPCN